MPATDAGTVSLLQPPTMNTAAFPSRKEDFPENLPGGPPLTIFASTIPAEGAPSLRFLQGWAAMLLVLLILL